MVRRVDAGTLEVTAAYGLAAGVLCGEAESDCYRLDAETLEPIRRQIARKAHAHRFDPAAGAVVRTAVPRDLQDRSALDFASLRALAEAWLEAETASADGLSALAWELGIDGRLTVRRNP